VEAAVQQMELDRRYGLSLTEIRQYTDAFEAFARPLLAGLAVSALVEILPRTLVRSLERANRVFVWSRLVQQLTDPNAEPLKAAEFVKLTALLRQPQAAARNRDPKRRAPHGEAQPATPAEEVTPERLRSLLQAVYGVTLDVPGAGDVAR
jgi:hypothetical protein